MNTKLNKKDEIQKAFKDLLTPTGEDLIELETKLLMATFLSEIEKICEERGLLKKDLAKMIGTSASYITQLFRGHKIINLETIAKIMLALDIRFDVKIKKKSDSTLRNDQAFKDSSLYLVAK